MAEGQGLRTFLDTEACSKSPVARFVQSYPTCSSNVIGHVRCATHGRARALENCHPFVREMWGLPWFFAHNGDVPVLANQRAGHHVRLGKTKLYSSSEEEELKASTGLVYHAMGDSDSEMLFCSILNALRAEFHSLPTLPDLFRALERLVDELVSKDETLINNFLLGCGPHTLFCYSWPGRRPESTVWNGLYYIVRAPPMERTVKLVDMDYSLELHLTKESDRMIVIATKPLTDEEGWVEMKPGELLLLERGISYSDVSSLQVIEKQGHGLSSRCFLKGEVNKEEEVPVSAATLPVSSRRYFTQRS
jgi:predicted glutamine amidotransferase